MFLGQVINSDNEVWELQLKGSGKTPFSRGSDGRKVLRSSIREFLCSEAMHYLGIPTTRCGTIVTSSTFVERDMFYTGNVIKEQATIISRIAPSFLRFGSFEIFKATDDITGRAGPSVGNNVLLKSMLDYLLEHHYSQFKSSETPSFRQYLDMFGEIVRLTAVLVARWQCVGFCHGVLNTDNMSILGLTIDYGPFGFLDATDLNHICNTSDEHGRYAYQEQPSICKWNLTKLSEAWEPFVPIEESKLLIDTFDAVYDAEYMEIMRRKLGFINLTNDVSDNDFVKSTMEVMSSTRVDFTNFFRILSTVTHDIEEGQEDTVLNSIVNYCDDVDTLKASMKPSIDPAKLKAIKHMIEQDPMLLYRLGADPDVILALIEKQRRYEEIELLDANTLKNKNKDSWTQWLKKYRYMTLM